MQMTKPEFYDYCKSFYGTGGTCEFNVPDGVLKSACALVQQRKDIPFDGDMQMTKPEFYDYCAFDQERVRNVIKSLGYEVTK